MPLYNPAKIHKVRITPYSERAKEIVRQQGDTLRLIADLGNRILVEGYAATWNDAVWTGWVSNVEASWIIVSEE